MAEISDQELQLKIKEAVDIAVNRIVKILGSIIGSLCLIIIAGVLKVTVGDTTVRKDIEFQQKQLSEALTTIKNNTTAITNLTIQNENRISKLEEKTDH